MFGIDSSELLLVAIVALVVIGPKDLPRVMRLVGQWVARARGAVRQFREGFDQMLREAELKELEAKWAAENERIMQQFPAGQPAMLAGADPADAPPVMTPQPVVWTPPAPAYDTPSDDDIAAAEGVPPEPRP
ncbi:MAG: hypothetical protein A4S16_07220 [Proteobacteria bacterium SG_bin6]|nr:MAG: hypothetical protein A4S16_07220 [Proteobacteria bacterium SG_bin6]